MAADSGGAVGTDAATGTPKARAHRGAASRGAVTASVEVVDLGAAGTIGTGICFLDHMIDQLNSHALLGVGLRVKIDSKELPAHEDYCGVSPLAASAEKRPHDENIVAACGEALGAALRSLVAATRSAPRALFCCPLDEALCEVSIDLAPSADAKGVATVDLAPFGAVPRGGRRWVGRLRTDLVATFWQSLASAWGAALSLRKIRGDNAHHIIESSFKAFARALRAALDSASADPSAPDPRQSPAKRPRVEPRRAARSRATKETSIDVDVSLDPIAAPDQSCNSFASGVPVLDSLLRELFGAAGFPASVRCNGDVHIDDHHTAEDVSIALGQCLHQALGDKKGLNRMACAEATSGLARVQVTLDLSNRPHFACNLDLQEEYVGGDAAAAKHDDGRIVGRALSSEMLLHVFDSLTLETRATGHVEQLAPAPLSGSAPGSADLSMDLAIAAARAYGKALAVCCARDPRRGAVAASSKGTLSV